MLSDPPYAPNPPSAPRVDVSTHNYYQLSWKPPTKDNKRPILSYHIQHSLANSSNWILINKEPINGTLTTVKFVSISDCREYQFRVYAKNEAGQSPPSPASQPTIVGYPCSSSSKRLTLSFADAKMYGCICIQIYLYIFHRFI